MKRGKLTIDSLLDPIEGFSGEQHLRTTIREFDGDYGVVKVMKNCILHGELTGVTINGHPANDVAPSVGHDG